MLILTQTSSARYIICSSHLEPEHISYSRTVPVKQQIQSHAVEIPTEQGRECCSHRHGVACESQAELRLHGWVEALKERSLALCSSAACNGTAALQQPYRLTSYRFVPTYVSCKHMLNTLYEITRLCETCTSSAIVALEQKLRRIGVSHVGSWTCMCQHSDC